MGIDVSSVLGIIIGIAIALAGIYYWQKEKNDKDSVKIYRTITMLGLAVLIIFAVKMVI